MWLDRRLILSQSDWGGLFASRRVVGSAYSAIFIGLLLLIINSGPSLVSGGISLQTIYADVIALNLVFLAFGIYFEKYYCIPVSVLVFNLSYIIVNIINTFIFDDSIKVITICYSIMYFIINAIVFRLAAVFWLNLTVFGVVLVCASRSLQIAEVTGSTAQPYVLNAIVLSGAGLLLQHLVLTVRGMLIEQMGAIRLQVAELEAEIEIENARREAREKAIQLNRISLVEALGAGIAHEINQPIAAALTYSRAARNWAEIECRGAPETLRAVAGVESNVERAARLVDNVRLLTTKKDRIYALVNVREIVRDQVNLVHAEFEKRGIKLLLEPAVSETTALVCASEVALATINLLRNAMEAFDGPADGAVVSVDCRGAGPGWIEVLVVDNGKGLAPEALQQAFVAFQTTKDTGIGIGLSICQEVAEHHSGSISLAANPGGGVTATLRLARKPHGC